MIVMIIILFEIADEKGEPSGRKVEWKKKSPLAFNPSKLLIHRTMIVDDG